MNSPVLMYHKIDLPTPDVKVRGGFTKPSRFRSQMAYLKRRGRKFYTASEIVRQYRELGHFPTNSICVTFDDGWKDNYTHAFPVLKEFGIPATIFLVPACVGERSTKVTTEGEQAREHLAEADILEMASAGIEFGSHGMNHALLDRIDSDEITSEVTVSKAYIENLLQRECSVFAYPAGFYTEAVQGSVQTAGYKAAFSTCYGRPDNSDLWALNRTEILRRDGYPFRFGRKIKAIP